MWFSKKSQPPIRSLIGEGTVCRAHPLHATACASTARYTATSWPTAAERSMLVISEKARVHGKVKAGM
jgi:hypothetical protein